MRKIPPTNNLKMLALFEEHLLNILPLYSSSYSDDKNQVIKYSKYALERAGRKVNIDRHYNVISLGGWDRATVAHTDAIGGHEKHATEQSIKYSYAQDILWNRTGKRPMGGDDKVGVAISLVLAEIFPDLNVWLTANEEVGCVGAQAIGDINPVSFALQFDRRGAIDMVTAIGGTKIASKELIKAAKILCPHRKEENGMSTDVGALIRRGACGTALNMSCGYYMPHDVREYIIYGIAQIAMRDAFILISQLHDEDLVPVAGYQKDEPKKKADKPSPPAIPPAKIVVTDRTPAKVDEPKPPSYTVDESKATSLIGEVQDDTIRYGNGSVITLLHTATPQPCSLCKNTYINPIKKMGIVDTELVCEVCLLAVNPEEASKLRENLRKPLALK